MAKEKTSRVQPVAPPEVSFVCRFCGETKPLSELTLQARFFPVLTACRACERAMQSLKIEEPPVEAAEDPVDEDPAGSEDGSASPSP